MIFYEHHPQDHRIREITVGTTLAALFRMHETLVQECDKNDDDGS